LLKKIRCCCAPTIYDFFKKCVTGDIDFDARDRIIERRAIHGESNHPMLQVLPARTHFGGRTIAFRVVGPWKNLPDRLREVHCRQVSFDLQSAFVADFKYSSRFDFERPLSQTQLLVQVSASSPSEILFLSRVRICEQAKYDFESTADATPFLLKLCHRQNYFRGSTFFVTVCACISPFTRAITRWKLSQNLISNFQSHKSIDYFLFFISSFNHLPLTRRRLGLMGLTIKCNYIQWAHDGSSHKKCMDAPCTYMVCISSSASLEACTHSYSCLVRITCIMIENTKLQRVREQPPLRLSFFHSQSSKSGAILFGRSRSRSGAA
jgi:hypothetical protein